MLINWLKKALIFLIVLVVIAGLFLYVYQKNNFQSANQLVPKLQELVSRVETQIIQKEEQVKTFPQLQIPVSRVFTWEYKGVKYSLTEKLHQSTYEYYKSSPKAFSYAGELDSNWQEQYYGMFLATNQADDSISVLATDLRVLGKKHKLSDDQVVDLVLAFVQAIKYDDAKAENILAQNGTETILYPYETLFEQAGVCSDKSLLAMILLRQMGYGTAIFAYEKDNHMAIGIACPKNVSTYGSGYCYAETTSVGNRIGIVPTFDASSNKTVGADELAVLDSNQTQKAKLQQLGQVTIYQKTMGKEYAGIIETNKIIAEIDSLKKNIETLLPQLQIQKKNITNGEKKLADMKKNLESYKNSENFEKYNSLVSEFNDFLEIYKKDVKKYNENVSLYNKIIARYNVLIKQ